MKKIFQWIWQKLDGVKLWSTICTILGYQLAQLQINYPECLPIPHQIPIIGGWCVPWSWILPLLTALGIGIGGGHKLVKRVQTSSALFTLLLLLTLAPIALAMRPGEVLSVNLTHPRGLVTISETIESTEPATISFALSMPYAAGADSVPIYIGVSTAQGYTGYQYGLTLINSVTGKAVFRNEETSYGRIASRKIKAWVKPPYYYNLTVSAPASQRYRDWLQRVRYSPPMKLDVGPYRSQQVDVTLP